MDAKREIESLREQLRHHNEKYYNEDAPEISDYEYDMMQRRLRALEAEFPEFDDPNSPTRRVGGTASAKFSKVPHAYPLESLQDVFNERLALYKKYAHITVDCVNMTVEQNVEQIIAALED